MQAEKGRQMFAPAAYALSRVASAQRLPMQIPCLYDYVYTYAFTAQASPPGP